ncbi:MAG: hypothetical protein IH991_17475 [Planctomycetes bacterium]|nr:hypothetical protein [Planctomycetota bacterium]
MITLAARPIECGNDGQVVKRRYSSITFILVIALLLCSLADAIFTLFLIDTGYTEVNPAMGYLLSQGVLPFVIGKYILTVLGLPILLIFQDHLLFGILRVRNLTPMCIVAYLILLDYQISLLGI